MSSKGIARFAIGIIIAAIVLAIVLPFVGVPQSQMLPPEMAYNRAKGKGRGVITGKREMPSPNPFRVGDKIYFISYRFSAPMPPSPFNKNESGKPAKYTGESPVSMSLWEKAVAGVPVAVKYDTTYPIISGLAIPGAERSVEGGSGLWSWWILWAILCIVLGYVLMPVIERVILRENF